LIPAIVVKVTSPQRVTIEYGYKVHGEWRYRNRSVSAAKLSPRTLSVPELVNNIAQCGK
jgi:hypothetical protein